MDAITLEVYRHRFAGIAEEMGVALRRTAYSPNIKERLDFSCALFDARGNLVAQAAHIPVHLGAMPASVCATLDAFPDWAPGDLAILNDPFCGGTHLPDITMISPVFGTDASPDFFVATRAHHADVGGMSPGSLPLSTEIFQEGLIIPPLKLVEAGVENQALLRLILRNVRTPDERRGDLAAQRAAHHLGERRLLELMTAQGQSEVKEYAAHLQAHSEKLVRAALAKWPEGEWSFADYLETNDGLVPIRVTARIQKGEVEFDFSGTNAQIFGSLNAVLSITQSACYYVVLCLLDSDVPSNAGCFTPIHVSAPAGCLVNAQAPSAVAAGNVETSQRIVDVVLGALAQALPEKVPAASQGTMNNLTIGGRGLDGTPFTYYETIAGGHGATPKTNGLSGTHSHMTNTLNTPIEVLERAFPFRVREYALRAGSGGAGLQSGGDGLVREYEMLAVVRVTLISQRREIAPWGLDGGSNAAIGVNVLIHPDGRREALAGSFSRQFPEGTILRLETPGGAGWGKV